MSPVRLPTLSMRQAWALVIALGLVLILGIIYWKNSQSLVRLRPNGKAVFIRGGFFRQDQFMLSRDGRNWVFYRQEPFETGDLILPFECPYNDYRTLRLENDGRVFMLDKDNMERTELRVVDGDWSYDAGDHWQSIFDLD